MIDFIVENWAELLIAVAALCKEGLQIGALFYCIFVDSNYLQRVVFYTNIYTMQKFFTVSTAANGDQIMPADGVVMVSTAGGAFTDTVVNYLSNTTYDVITITHAADTASGNNMIDYIQNKLIEVAGSKWSESMLDITDGAPTVISNIVIS